MDIFSDLDDELLDFSELFEQSANEEVVENPHAPLEVVDICFNCSGEHSDHQKCAKTGFLHNRCVHLLFQPSSYHWQSKLLFDDEINDDTLCDEQLLDVMVNKARMNIRKLSLYSRSGAKSGSTTTCFEIRLQVTAFLHRLVNISNLIEPAKLLEILLKLRTLLGSVDSIENISALHAAYNSNGNETQSAGYHFLHGQLEWRWLLLTTSLKVHCQSACVTLQDSAFEKDYLIFISDLVVLSLCKYNKLNTCSLMMTAPFACVCIRECWLLAQALAEKLQEKFNFCSFWTYFDRIIKNMSNETNFYKIFQQPSAVIRNTKIIPCANINEFSLWLCVGVAKLYKYSEDGSLNNLQLTEDKENYLLLERICKALFAVDLSEEQLRLYLQLILPIVSTLWAPKVDIVMIMWEYFHKKLNSSFFVAGAAPITMAVVSRTPAESLQQIKLHLHEDQMNSNSTSFSMFVNLIGKLFVKFTQSGQRNSMQRVLGRIYSKFTTTKLLSLNETGIHNVVSLFLTIAVTVDLSEMGQKIQDLLLQLPLDKINLPRQVCLAKGHFTLLYLLVERKLSISSYLQKLSIQWNTVADHPNTGAVLKVGADGVQAIFANTITFQMGEHLLLGPWISKFLFSCSAAEQASLLATFNETLSKLNRFKTDEMIIDQKPIVFILVYLFQNVLPCVKQCFIQDKSISCLAELAVNFCFAATGNDGLPKFDELFRFFVDTNCVNIRTSIRFMCLIFSMKNNSYQLDETILIRNWIKCSILSGTENAQDMAQLTSHITLLNDFNWICGSSREEMLEARDTLAQFIIGIRINYDKCPDFRKRMAIVDKVHLYVAPIEKLAITVSHSSETMMRIYSVISIILLKCGSIVYIRSKSSCFFNIAMTQFILPCSLLMGKPQLPHIIQIIHKMLPVLVSAFATMDYKSDSYLNKSLSDLIVKWIPQFNVSSNMKLLAKPFITCVKRNDTALVEFILEKIINAYIVLHEKQSSVHAGLAISILNEILLEFREDVSKMEFLLNTICTPLFEYVLLSDDLANGKAVAYKMFEEILASAAFRDSTQLNDTVTLSLKTITSKHLSFHSSLYFQFMLKLTKINAQLIGNIVAHLRDQIVIVEILRGGNRDNRLRNQLENLEGAILLSK